MFDLHNIAENSYYAREITVTTPIREHEPDFNLVSTVTKYVIRTILSNKNIVIISDFAIEPILRGAVAEYMEPFKNLYEFDKNDAREVKVHGHGGALFRTYADSPLRGKSLNRALIIRNGNLSSKDYEQIRSVLRPMLATTDGKLITLVD